MTVPYYSDEWVTIYHGDCRQILPEVDAADLIFTDPPYPREFAWAYSIVGEHAGRLLPPGGSCLAYCGHFMLPEVITRIVVPPMEWWWIAKCDHDGAMAWMSAYRIKASWKPVVWIRKPPLFPPSYSVNILDRLRSPRAKSLHPWGQGLEGYEIMDALTPAGGTILDPFLGSGTTLRAAKALGRKAIGIEIEERYCEIAANRCAQEVLAI